MASTKPLAKPTSSKPPNTPTSALAQPLSAIHITTDQVQQLLDMLKQGQRTSNAGTEACTSEEKDDKSTPRIRASKPDIKKVYQMYAQYFQWGFQQADQLSLLVGTSQPTSSRLRSHWRRVRTKMINIWSTSGSFESDLVSLPIRRAPCEC